MTGYYKGDANKLFSLTREDRGNCLKLQQETGHEAANLVMGGGSGLHWGRWMMTSR